jgi:hypothetical protein
MFQLLGWTTCEQLARGRAKSKGGGMLAVNFRQPRTFVMLWFELHFGTNPPLGIIMI